MFSYFFLECVEDHFKFAVLHVHVQQYIVPYSNCLVALLMVLLLVHWRCSNRDCVFVNYRNTKTSSKRFLNTFGRNVIIQWPFNFFVWNFAQLCENILPTTKPTMNKMYVHRSFRYRTFKEVLLWEHAVVYNATAVGCHLQFSYHLFSYLGWKKENEYSIRNKAFCYWNVLKRTIELY